VCRVGVVGIDSDGAMRERRSKAKVGRSFKKSVPLRRDDPHQSTGKPAPLKPTCGNVPGDLQNGVKYETEIAHHGSVI
jgi:hypothetical protein